MIIQQPLPQHVILIILNAVKFKQRYEENEKLLKIVGETKRNKEHDPVVKLKTWASNKVDRGKGR